MKSTKKHCTGYPTRYALLYAYISYGEGGHSIFSRIHASVQHSHVAHSLERRFISTFLYSEKSILESVVH
jgi:hypothetical protein